MLLDGRVVGLIEDDPVMGESLVQSLSLEGCHVDWWKTGEEALRGLRATSPDLVVCDIKLPDINGDDLFRQLAAASQVPPFLFVTAYGDIDQAVAIMRAGGSDYVTKPFDTGAFIERARSLIQRNPMLRADAVLGVSDAMRDIETMLRRVCDRTTPLLTTGETGVGKEVCTRFLHRISQRSKEPFIGVNCAAIPADFMENEFFGHKGTGGTGFHRGFAERARGGILFLDEVAELPTQFQAKLLRLVETREFNRVGGEQLLQFYGRIVCSTNSDLTAAVREGRFREDLYYRINAMSVEVPALKSRPDDIPWLMDLFFQQYRHGDRLSAKGFSTLAQEAALEYSWPGNVRELKNRVERALTLANGEWIMPMDLFPDFVEAEHPLIQAFATLSQTRDFAERRQIERAIKETNGHIIEAAKLLGISRTTLWEKMRRLEITGEFR
ncbi:MAG: sigma-54 dependent transcriptional regulator [Fimbriimonadaceae bacterium]|nr:sigma-54 dependent transcriptional regulator [Alphaproteobacteria bacterium]